jgi:uncharacterized protein
MITAQFTEEQIQLEQARFITKVYGWMAAALILTGLTAYGTASTPALINLVTGNDYIYFGLLAGTLLVVIIFSMLIEKMSANQAVLGLMTYAVLTGLTSSTTFVIYTGSSIAATFLVTSGTFGLMSAFGYYTKRDLTTEGNLAYMGLTGVVIASIANLFFSNTIIDWINTYVGIVIFVALIAYDTNKIKEMNIIGNDGTEEDKKEAVIGAFELYLDIINLFIRLLDIFGKKK